MRPRQYFFPFISRHHFLSLSTPPSHVQHTDKKTTITLLHSLTHSISTFQNNQYRWAIWCSVVPHPTPHTRSRKLYKAFHVGVCWNWTHGENSEQRSGWMCSLAWNRRVVCSTNMSGNARSPMLLTAGLFIEETTTTSSQVISQSPPVRQSSQCTAGCTTQYTNVPTHTHKQTIHLYI